MDSEERICNPNTQWAVQLCSVWFSMCVFAHSRAYVCALSSQLQYCYESNLVLKVFCFFFKTK